MKKKIMILGAIGVMAAAAFGFIDGGCCDAACCQLLGCC